MSGSLSRRGVIVPAVTTAIIVLALLSLGVWQLERRADKLALISALDERLSAAVGPLPPSERWNELTQTNDEFRRVSMLGFIEPGREAHVYSSGTPLRKDVTGPGVWAFAPVHLSGRRSNENVVVNRGFVPDGVTSPVSPYREPITLTGYIRFPESPGWFTPPADIAKRLWFLRDHLAMSRALGWVTTSERMAPFYIDLESPVPPGGVPRPGSLQVNLKNDHLQYAITWFLLAFAVAVTFGFWLRSQSRQPSPSL